MEPAKSHLCLLGLTGFPADWGDQQVPTASYRADERKKKEESLKQYQDQKEGWNLEQTSRDELYLNIKKNLRRNQTQRGKIRLTRNRDKHMQNDQNKTEKQRENEDQAGCWTQDRTEVGTTTKLNDKERHRNRTETRE